LRKNKNNNCLITQLCVEILSSYPQKKKKTKKKNSQQRMGVVIRIGVIGIGLVGKALLSQLGHSKFKDKLQLVAVATSTKMLLDNNKPALEFLAINSNEKFAALDLDAFATFVSGSNPSNSIIVDCTASENVSKMYPQWLKEGINVVTPNKKGFSSDYSLFEKVLIDKLFSFSFFFFFLKKNL